MGEQEVAEQREGVAPSRLRQSQSMAANLAEGGVLQAGVASRPAGVARQPAGVASRPAGVVNRATEMRKQLQQWAELLSQQGGLAAELRGMTEYGEHNTRG